MYRNILVPIDLADTALAKPAIAAARVMASQSSGGIRLVNVLPLTPVVLAEYVPADFDAQQRKAAEEALAILAGEIACPPSAYRPRCARAASIRRFWRRPWPAGPTSS